jgi:mevalonate kinase
LVYEVEKYHHGTPSGIDNTVVCYERPVYFVKGHPPEPFTIGRPFHLLIGDTGIPSPTRETVGAVRAAWQVDPTHYEALFERVGSISEKARQAIAQGRVNELGPLMDKNQRLLEEMGVSSPELERLIRAAREAGADGAKLSGGGGGGNMIALAAPSCLDTVGQALRAAGAVRVLQTEIR